MLHLRVVSPPQRTEAVLALLTAGPASFNVVVHRGAALAPAGDLVTCDLAREGANEVLEALRRLDIHRVGSIALHPVTVAISDAAAAAERLAPGLSVDAAVWEEVDARVRDESALSAGYLTFLVVASLIAAVGLVQDQPILIVGAMVVGPEFGPIAGLSVGLYKFRLARIRVALTSLAVGLGAGMLATAGATALVESRQLIPAGFEPGGQPLTGFVVDPSALSFVVAFLAGIAGTLSLTQAKAGALVGVLISVATIPAVAAVGVSAALGDWVDARGAAVQLGLNLSALVLAGVVTLWVQRRAWESLMRRRGRVS